MQNLYNPFDKEILHLTEDDLNSLIGSEICEGWYIEYKSDIPKTNSGNIDNMKISKTIAAFANTRGGWIFWGITCDEKNKPSALSGIDLATFSNFEDQLAKIINSNISGRPYYHFKRVDLKNGKSVFIVQVEEGPAPPYVTSQGVIYQRENNETKPIKDRYILEKLSEKADEYYDAIERFTVFDLPETKGQAEWNQTYLEMYLFPLPFGSFQFQDFYTSDFFKTVAAQFYHHTLLNIKDINGEIINVPLNINFNSIFSSENSLIIRPLTDNNLIYKSTTVELMSNGGLKFLMPVFEFTPDNIPDCYNNSKTIKYLLNFYTPDRRFSDAPDDNDSDFAPYRKAATDFVNHVKFIDGIELIISILLLVSKYKAVLSDSGYDFSNKLGFRAKITNCWRKFVFFDNDDYLEKIKLFNIPLSPKDEIEIPVFRRASGYTIDLSNENADFILGQMILEGIGLPDSSSIDFFEILKAKLKSIKSVQDATKN